MVLVKTNLGFSVQVVGELSISIEESIAVIFLNCTKCRLCLSFGSSAQRVNASAHPVAWFLPKSSEELYV